MNNEYRFYSITNMYLSDIQRGIQTAHLVSEMMTKYREPDRVGPNYDAARKVFTDWAELHKTIIVLNGGASENLRNAHARIKELAHHLVLPFVKFHEDEYSLDGALTAVGVIVPNFVYSEHLMLPMHLTSSQIEATKTLHEYLRSFNLA